MEKKIEILNHIKNKLDKLKIDKLELIIYILDNLIYYHEFTKDFCVMSLQEIYKEKQVNLISMLNK